MKFAGRIAVLLGCFFFLVTGAFAGGIEGIRFMTEEYPPFNMSNADGLATGIAVDVLVGMFERLGVSKTAADVEVLPWARGYKEVQEKPNTALFCMTHTQERDPLFTWVGPVAPTRISAFALKSRGLTINSPEEMQDLAAAVIRDDVGDALAQGAGIKNIDRAATNDQNIKKLNAGRVDIWIYEESVAQWQIKDFGFNPEDYEVVYVLSSAELDYAFHKDTDTALIEQLQKTLDDMKTDGSYQAILDQYLR